VTDAPALETFVAVARLGSVQAAAVRLHRTQPSVSSRIAGLEARWRTRLFRRHARGMSLTPEGARLLPLAEAALSGIAELDRAAGRPVASEAELRLGAGDALGREVVPRALARLLGRGGRLAVRVLEAPAVRLLEALRAGEIDLALVAADAAGPPAAGLVTEPLLTSPIEALFPKGDAPGPRNADPAALAKRRLVALQPGSEFRRHLERAFAGRGLPFRPAVEVGNLSLVRRFVAAGLGVGLVPAVAFSARPSDVAVTSTRARGIPPIAYVHARRAGVPPSESAEQFLRLVRPEL
jgi:DNA-binding transcriptional LysR family regulator